MFVAAPEGFYDDADQGICGGIYYNDKIDAELMMVTSQGDGTCEIDQDPHGAQRPCMS